MTYSTILIVEDDTEIADFLSVGLRAEGYDILVEPNGANLLDHVREDAVKLVILDRMLPDAEGADLCRRLRAADSDVLVLMLTARDALQEKLEGFRAGADDYVTKPFAFEELLARVEVLLRRSISTEPLPQALTFADMSIDISRKTAQRAGIDLGLTATEFNLLRYFLENAERVVSRMEILNAVWGYDFDPNTNIVEVYIAYLRKKLESGGGIRLIQNVRGFGYRLSVESDPRD
ncbi:response regulator transcription factor [Qingshengfaniella alkalisoli]|uniref:Response regulator transcription factor n=1 Tax=Qingshengfaniella alkalisoli TaxID=2599296 RepID=A0A5B8J1D5_9RHOB|nr:response regulator transcription factor [Qingshengfaniella alkalisoli]QDY71001.1 response regulator transcription factor [Qingshengfaniella alkalisoli]